MSVNNESRRHALCTDQINQLKSDKLHFALRHINYAPRDPILAIDVYANDSPSHNVINSKHKQIDELHKRNKTSLFAGINCGKFHVKKLKIVQSLQHQSYLKWLMLSSTYNRIHGLLIYRPSTSPTNNIDY
ncbi:CLUMA_CG010851, isoform A [Clunio marinus]|uniref:CLUMA_CG010851, isoform A n=1 Tax=Clunio marinus TaxID=568069 RepID=A0A1J1IEN6_9DIPT|nr:CLUMA_CG010851, isoform A [Clunio marinus]